MNKKEYLMNQFKRTYQKKYENYCIVRIYTLLNNLNIKIVTQQLFKRDDGKIALADLYFPQLKCWVEIDENHHGKHKEEDKEREKEIIRNKQNALDEIVTDKLECFRIDVGEEQNIENINQQIDNIVVKINDKIKKLGDKFVVWDINEKRLSYYINKGYIEFKDDVKFRTIFEITNLFNKNYKGYQRGDFKTGFDNEIVWCPTLYLENGDERKYKNNNWINRISEDHSYIYERKKENNDEAVEYALENENQFIRFVFPRYKDPSGELMYKYRGKFVLDKELTKKEQCKVWKKIGDKIDLTKYFEI